MMKKILILLVIFNLSLFAQLRPENYSLGESTLSKTTADKPVSNSITDILIDDLGNVWLGTSRGLSKSTDNGVSWENYYNHPDFGNEGIIALGFDKGILWTSLGHSTEAAGSTLPEGAGFRYSTNYGETWTKIAQPVDDPGDSIFTYGNNQVRALPVTVKINNISYDIAFTKNTVWIASFAGGLRKSNDMGQTWQRVLLPSDSLNSIKPEDQINFSLQPVGGKFGKESYLNHRVFSVVGIDSTTLYVGTAGGINKSTDNGLSWQKFNRLNQDNPICGNFVPALAFDKVTKTLWAATWKAEDQLEEWGVSSSEDGGQNWNVFLIGEKAHNFGFKEVIKSPYSHVFAPTDNGIFRSSDKGHSWYSPPSIQDDLTKIPISTDIFYSMTSKKLSGNTSDIWIGSDNGLTKLTESDGFWDGQWTVFIASSGETKKDETFAFPNPFSPNLETVKIKFAIAESSADVSIRIFDFGMNLVKTLMQNAPRGRNNEQIEFWDGRDERGNVPPNGVYFYRIDINENEPLFGKILLLK